MPFLEDHDYLECPDCDGDGREQDGKGQYTNEDCYTCGGTGGVDDG